MHRSHQRNGDKATLADESHSEICQALEPAITASLSKIDIAFANVAVHLCDTVAS